MSEKTVNKKGKKKHRINLFSRFVAFLARPLLWLVYPTKILGKERFPGGGGLCVCNHFTPMDANPILCRLIKKNRHVMIKGEMFKNRLVGDFLRAMGGIPVRRGEADLAAVKEVMSALKKGEKVVVFPEYYDMPSHEIEDRVTAIMREKMLETRRELIDIVENYKGSYKKYLAAKEGK